MDPRLTQARYALLGLLVFFSLLVLGLSGHLISFYTAGFVPALLGLDLAMAVITLVVVVPSTAIDFFRKGAFTSMVGVQIGWSSLLMVLWIAAAGTSSGQLAFLSVSCNYVDGFGNVDSAADIECHEAQALEAFTWLAFFTVLGYQVALLSLAITQHSRGNTNVWKSSVADLNLTTASSKVQMLNQGYDTPQMQPGMMQQGMMQPQYTGYSQGSQGYPPSNGYNPNGNIAHV